MKKCLVCNSEFKSGRNQKYCSLLCSKEMRKVERKIRYISHDVPLRSAKMRARGLPAAGDFAICQHPLCENTFEKRSCRLFCSTYCLNDSTRATRSPDGFGEKCAVYFHKCVDCGAMAIRKNRGVKIKLCKDCQAVRRRAVDARKNNNRRTYTKLEMTVIDIAKRDGARCNLCQKIIDLNLGGNVRLGPTIDHLIPISQGGTNESSNLSLAHRCCNVSRKNVKPVQLLLTA